MTFYKSFSIWKLALLLLCFYFAPHSLNNSFKHASPQINADFFFSLLIMISTIFCSWLLLQWYQKKSETFLHKALSALEKSICNASPFGTILLCCFFIFLTVNIVSALVYDYVPRVSDEIAQLFQAKIFLAGNLYAAAPALPEFFTYAEDNMIVSPQWYSQYPPGFPFLLMVGLWLGSPWIINPLLAALSVICVFLLCRETFDHNTAILAAILFALSPKVIFTSASLMNHTASMFFMLLSFAAIVISLKRQRAFLALCSGLALGMSLNIRFLDAVVLSIPIGIYTLAMCRKNGSTGLRILGIWLCGFCVMAGIFLCYNYLTNGDPFLSGYVVRWGGESHNLGFHEVRGGAVHTPFRGFINALWQIRLFDKAMFEWPIPITFFIMFLFLFARTSLWDWIFLSIAVVNIGLYFFWGWADTAFCGRFYFNSAPYLTILVARGVMCFVQFLSGNSVCEKIQLSNRKLAGALLAVAVFSLIAISVRSSDLKPQYNLPHLQVDRRVQRAVKQQHIQNAIVFIEPQDKHELLVGSGFFMNTPNLASQDVIYAKDLGEKNYKLVQVFPGRQGYIYRHRRDVQKIIDDSYCISPPEAFELIPLKQ